MSMPLDDLFVAPLTLGHDRIRVVLHRLLYTLGVVAGEVLPDRQVRLHQAWFNRVCSTVRDRRDVFENILSVEVSDLLPVLLLHGERDTQSPWVSWVCWLDALGSLASEWPPDEARMNGNWP